MLEILPLDIAVGIIVLASRASGHLLDTQILNPYHSAAYVAHIPPQIWPNSETTLRSLGNLRENVGYYSNQQKTVIYCEKMPVNHTLPKSWHYSLQAGINFVPNKFSTAEFQWNEVNGDSPKSPIIPYSSQWMFNFKHIFQQQNMILQEYFKWIKHFKYPQLLCHRKKW